MKRFLIALTVSCLVCFLWTAPVFAANATTYRLDELGLRIDVPDDYIVFTREFEEDDPNLSLYGLTKEMMESLLESRNIYLNAWDVDANYEIIVTMVENPLENFAQFSDAALSAMISSIETAYESLGVTYLDSEIYRHKQAKFIKIYSSRPSEENTVYGLQYYTIYAGKAINITMQSYSGAIDGDKETILKGIVDSARFDTDPQRAEPLPPSSAFTYTDADSGAFFTVPENWVESPMHEERDSIDAKFTLNTDDGLCIIFSSEDVWNALSEAEKKQISKGAVNSSIFTKADIAKMCGCTQEAVSTVAYGGKEYYQADVVSNGTVYGLDVSIPVIILVRCENGYMYMFQTNARPDQKHFGDFEKLVSSVTYPSYHIVPDLPLQYAPGAGFILNLIFTITIYSLPIIIYRYAIRKEPVDKKKAKRITIIYGICAFAVMSVLLYALNGDGLAGGAILLWSWVNYRVLVSGESAYNSIELPPR